ncbi:MAG: hypothetical protein JWQ32_815 [Marmoricola sp.]|nr:hypothetical protein [Marmoricola sp.]
MVAGLVLAGTGITGCGSTAPAADPKPGASVTTPSVTATPTPTVPAVSHTPTPTPTRSGGNGDSTDPHKPATAGGGICSDITDAEVAHVLGGTYTGSAIAGGPGCSFVRANPKAPAATFIETSYAKTTGGMSGAKTDATSSVEGTPVDLAGIGDAAFVVTGTTFGGPYVNGAGAVRIGDRLINVTLDQSTGLGATQVRSLVVALLRLAAGQAGRP